MTNFMLNKLLEMSANDQYLKLLELPTEKLIKKVSPKELNLIIKLLPKHDIHSLALLMKHKYNLIDIEYYEMVIPIQAYIDYND